MERLELLKNKINAYFCDQIYSLDIETKVSEIIEMSIDEIRDHLDIYNNINYITYQYILQGAPKQHISNDINKFISHYIISCIRSSITNRDVAKSIVRTGLKSISMYKSINEDLYNLLIEFINKEVDTIINVMEECEEFETCSNLLYAKDYLLSII
jgi:hypothetical protein